MFRGQKRQNGPWTIIVGKTWVRTVLLGEICPKVLYFFPPFLLAREKYCSFLLWNVGFASRFVGGIFGCGWDRLPTFHVNRAVYKITLHNSSQSWFLGCFFFFSCTSSDPCALVAKGTDSPKWKINIPSYNFQKIITNKINCSRLLTIFFIVYLKKKRLTCPALRSWSWWEGS